MKTQVCVVFVLLACLSSASAREYQKAPAVVNPLRAVDEDSSAVFPSGYFNFGHWRYDIKASDWDLFEMRTSGAATLYQHDARIGVGLFFSSILASGPGPEGWQPPTEVEWRMDAVQFEYGLHVAYRIGLIDLFIEYSRSSFHPFRDDAVEQYQVNTADYIRAGLMPVPVRYGPIEAEGYLRTGWLDLFDIWDAPYGPPRAFWKTTVATWFEFPLRARERSVWMSGDGVGPRSCRGPRLFLHLEPELLMLRAGGIGADFYGEIGVRLPGNFGNIDLFLNTTRIGDVEEIRNREVPVTLLGLGFRFSAEPERQPPVVIR